MIITKVTTITETSVQSVGQVQGTSVTQSQGSGQKGEVSIDSIAPKLNSTVLNAYHALGFTVTIDPGVSYTGYFNAKNQAIILKIFSPLSQEMWIQKQIFRRCTKRKAASMPERIRPM